MSTAVITDGEKFFRYTSAGDAADRDNFTTDINLATRFDSHDDAQHELWWLLQHGFEILLRYDVDKLEVRHV